MQGIRSGSPLAAVAALCLQACLFGGNDDDDSPAAYRKPPTPKVTYETLDSLIEVRIQGRAAGEARAYWIYRDKVLLDQPYDLGSDSLPGGRFLYRLVDSVQAPGTYTYRVYYGPHQDSLSDPSEPYAFTYSGPSPSGHVRAYVSDFGTGITVEFRPRRGGLFRKAVIERRVGPGGETVPIDTLVYGVFEGLAVLDTSVVAEDTWLYYRSRVYSADEAWLEPSPWDSIEVKNKEWIYLPAVTVRNQGTDIRVTVINPAPGASVTYLLYRNDKEGKDGKTLVDSAGRSSFGEGVVLADLPEDAGAYWYWVEARDGHGRASVRSNPARVVFTGRPKGPAITSLQGNSAYVQIYHEQDPEARMYVLERAQDTSRSPVAVDTLIQPSGTAFMDRPPMDGTWHYRVVSYYSDERRSDPGDWSTLRDWRYVPTYALQSASLSNRGERVEVRLTSARPGTTYILYRSAHPTGRDSVAVDTLVQPGSFFTEGLLSDAPDKGTWYYRVFGTRTEDFFGDILRSEILRVEFTGRAVGPSVTGLVNSYRYVSVTFPGDPEAAAYVLERASDGASDWKAVDTLTANGPGTVIARDTPPSPGYWRYRVRSLRGGLVATDPGTSMRTPTAWSDAILYENTLAVQVVNNGTQVVIDGFFPTFEYEHIILRSDKPDHKDGKAVATRGYSQGSRYVDVPPAGTWYYWVERHYVGTGLPPSSVARSAPYKVVFTGGPEIAGLTASSSGITVAFPAITSGDTLQVWRSKTTPEDGAFELLRVVSSWWETSILDGVDKDKSQFYHYRLRLIRGGAPTPMGGIKSIYYDPGSP